MLYVDDDKMIQNNTFCDQIKFNKINNIQCIRDDKKDATSFLTRTVEKLPINLPENYNSKISSRNHSL